MRLADSHCHLDFAAFDRDRHEVLRRAREGGVEVIVVAGCAAEREQRERALRLCAEHPGWLALVSGVHPHETDRLEAEDLLQIEALALQGHLVGIGETGLDFHYDLSARDRQRDAFRWFLRLARKVGLPVVIHTREADDETVRILGEEGLPEQGGVIHCFSGGPKLAQAALEMGLHLGLTGMVTFPKAEELRSILRDVPLERLMLETDAPYLSPVPYRGKRNEPARVLEVARWLAGARGLPLEDVARITTENCRRLFGI